MSEIIISVAFWGAAAFMGGFAFTAWRKKVCLILFAISAIMTAIYFSGNVAQALLVEGINTLWNVLNAFGLCNPITTFFALIAGLYFGNAYKA